MSFIVAHAAASSRVELKLVANLRTAATLEAAADGAVYQTIYHLLATGNQRWATVGTHEILVGETTVLVSLEDLTGRVNPNTATPELLRAMLLALGVNPSSATALADAIVLRRMQDGRIARTRFSDLDDLAAIRGMTPDVLARLRPHLTLWWENDPDPARADPIVTTAMQTLGDIRSRLTAIERPVKVVSIVTRAIGAGGARVARHAEAIVNTAAPRQRWRIVAWNTL